MTIFCTPGGSSSPLVSFFFFSSNIASNSMRCLRETVLERLELRGRLFVGQADVEPVVALDSVQIVLGDLGALGELLRAAVGVLPVSSRSRRSKASSSTMRSWSFRSIL